MILIVAPRSDDHAGPVASELRRRGARVSFLDLEEIPERARLSVSISPADNLHAWIERAEDQVDLDDVRTIWLRRTTTPRPAVLDAGFAAAECLHLLVGLGQALTGQRWVNPLHALALDSGWGKVRQLQVARKAGLEIPRTLMSNDPVRVREFAESCAGGVIYKPFACPDGLFANDVTERLRDARHLASVARAPGIYQERVAKVSDLRVTVMGSEVFACEVHSQGEPESRVDYRRKCFTLPRSPITLPRDVSERLVALHRELGLEFGTCDFVRRPDGRFVFLEVNQQGQWLRVGEAPGVPLVEPFVDFLLSGNPLCSPAPVAYDSVETRSLPACPISSSTRP